MLIFIRTLVLISRYLSMMELALEGFADNAVVSPAIPVAIETELSKEECVLHLV